MQHAVVAVLPGGTLDDTQLPATLAGLVDPRPHTAAGLPWWDLLGLADGTLFQLHHPSGADLLKATYSSHEDYRCDRETNRITLDLLIRAARDLGGRYGFVTRYSDWCSEPLLTNRTLTPLASHDWEALHAAPHEAWLHTVERPHPLVGRHVVSGPWGAVLGANREGEPPHRILIPPAGWTVQFSHLRQQEPDELSPDDDWFWFLEDIAYFRRDDGVGIDIGWSPDQDPAGHYIVSHVRDPWTALSAPLLTRSLAAVVEHVERLWAG